MLAIPGILGIPGLEFGICVVSLRWAVQIVVARSAAAIK
jgi:hypothetical protein